VKKMSATIPYEQNPLICTTEKTQLLRRRNKYDMLALILAACKKQPRTQSWLIAHLGLSTRSAKNFLRFLVAARLIEAHKPQGGKKNYITTADGKKALKHYVVLTTQYFSI